MSLAVVCAPPGVSTPRQWSECRKFARAGTMFADFNRDGARKRSCGGLACRASSGGSRRDYQKIVARTQHRRARHVKGVTPSKPDLLNALEEEEMADELLEALDPEESAALLPAAGEGEGEEFTVSEDVLQPEASFVGDAWTPESETEGTQEANLGGESTVSEDVLQPEASFVGDTWTPESETEGTQEANLGEEVQQDVEDVAKTSRDAVDETGRILQQTGKEVGDNAEEIRKEGENVVRTGAEIVDKQAGQAVSDLQQGVEEAGSTAQEVADVMRDTAEVSGRQLQDTGKDVRRNIGEIGAEGKILVRKGAEVVSEQAQDGASQVGKQVEEVGIAMDRAVRTISTGVEQAFERVQDPIGKAVGASLEAAEALGRETLGFGQVLVDAAEQATGMAGTMNTEQQPVKPEGKEVLMNRQGVGQVQSVSQKTDGGEGSERKYKPATKEVLRNKEGIGQGEELKQNEVADAYTGLKVLVAGASGRTGRLIVKNLASKGVPVRALVRDVSKARDLKKLQDVEVVEGDLYKYETIKKALGDSNVVICAIGAQGVPFDLLQTYQVEYEGVLNLISAAKNQGKVKKFVFMTTLGISYFQFIPLLFWKRQAELFLQRSGLDYTIVRPGGLRSSSAKNERVELRPADSQFIGGISRSKVAEVCIAALIAPESSEKIVEVVAGTGRVESNLQDQFGRV